MADASNALVLGDGDGRFLRALLVRAPKLQVTAVDKSHAMNELAKSRADRNSTDRVRFYCADARLHGFQSDSYDLILTHFFLDCFSDCDLRKLVPRIAASAKPGARWVISEFSVSTSGLKRVRAQVWIKLLYWCFGWATGLKVRQLPDYRAALAAAGFQLEQEEFASWGLLVSQLWRKSD